VPAAITGPGSGGSGGPSIAAGAQAVLPPAPAAGGNAPAKPASGDAAGSLVESVAQMAADAARAVTPGAVAVVATALGFPLALMALVFLFLLVQSRLDRRDPKLAADTQANADALVRFEVEDEL
jgi:hypothetical protein